MTAADAARAACEAAWQARGFVPLGLLFDLAAATAPGAIGPRARALCLSYNGAMAAQDRIRAAAAWGDEAAADIAGWMAQAGLAERPAQRLSADRIATLEAALIADPAGYVAAADRPYPLSEGGSNLGFDAGWTAARLSAGQDRLAAFVAGRRSDTAVLLGNGPSLNAVDLSLLRGRDVYISNYAMRHPALRRLARGVAVTNLMVAEQAPFVFHDTPLWSFHPVWMGHVIPDRARTVWLNAVGGPLFFGAPVTRAIAWHATVSFFWLQILYHAGYRRVLMAGFDNSYVQPKGIREGVVLHQTAPDPNHFDPRYFQGKTWQAADTDHMAATYALARQHYEADGRVILNCTAGGRLEVFDRQDLATALAG